MIRLIMNDGIIHLVCLTMKLEVTKIIAKIILITTKKKLKKNIDVLGVALLYQYMMKNVQIAKD